MNKIIAEKLEDIKKLCKLYKVKKMHVFGSASTGNLDESSDVDLLIEFDDMSIEQYTNNYFDLHYNLQNLFNRNIDLLTQNSLSNPYFIKKIEQTKKLIYAI